MTFRINAGTLEAGVRIAGTLDILLSGTHDEVEHRWLRMSRSPTELLWHTSRDGLSWTLWHSEPLSMWSTADLRIGLGVAEQGNPSEVIYDNLTVWTAADDS